MYYANSFQWTYLWFKEIWIEVDTKTVRRYTGLIDKNGKRIFEGDIVQAYKYGEEKFEENITFKNGCFWFGNWNFAEFLSKFRNYEVIGNVYDDNLTFFHRTDKSKKEGNLK